MSKKKMATKKTKTKKPASKKKNSAVWPGSWEAIVKGAEYARRAGLQNWPG